MIKVVQLRLVAETEADARTAIEALREAIGSSRIALSAPHQGRKGGWLAYGTLQVEADEQQPTAATGPTERLRKRGRP